MKLKLFLGALAFYLVAAAVVAALTWHFDQASVAVRRRVVELGEAHAPLPTAQMKPLKEACKGKLTAGAPRSIAAYVAKLAPAQMPSLEEDYWHVDQTVIGVHEVFRLELDDRHLKEISEAPLPRFSDIVDVTVWSNHLRWASRGSPELNEVKYLVAARYESLTMPEVGDSTFTPGRGTYGAQVLAFPSGEVLCEGRAELGMTSRVSASGHGESEASENARKLVPFVFTQSVIASPLHELCATGGPALCDLTAYWVSR